MANALTSLFGGNPEKAPIGSGMADRSRNTIAMKTKYDKYAQEAMINGEEPMPFEQWVLKQSQG